MLFPHSLTLLATNIMTDVWISRKRWTCKYCDITINDDVPSRRHHESGLRHKANAERALRDTYRKGERERKEADQARREMERIEKAALASYTLDQSRQAAGVASESPAEQSSSSPSAQLPAWKPQDKLAAYGSAQAIGLEEDAEVQRQQRLQEERNEKGFAGDWEEMPSVAPPAASSTSARQAPSRASVHFVPSERQQARSFQVRERRALVQEDEDEDGLESIKVKKRIKVETNAEASRREEEARARMLPTWTPIKLDPSVAAESPAPAPVSEQPAIEAAAVKMEESPADIKADASGEAAPTEASSGGFFKKRRAGVGSGAKKVRALV